MLVEAENINDRLIFTPFIERHRLSDDLLKKCALSNQQ